MVLVRIDSKTVVNRDWQKFVERGNIPKNISNEVVKSWGRSREYGIDPYGGKSNIILTSQKLKERLDKNKHIINIAKPYMKQMYNNIKLDGYIVFLTDDEGNIIYVDGDKNVMDSFKQNLNFFVGASWSEEAVGTTAVSLAISTGRPIPFVSQEKYCCQLKRKACTAVPIMDCEEQIIAILGVAADFPNPNPHIYSILLSAKMIIENFLRTQMLSEELNVLNACYRKIFHSVSDPIIMLDNNGTIIDLNSKAKEIIKKDNKDAEGISIVDLIGFNPMISGISKYNVDNNVFLRKMVPVYNDGNNVKLAIGFLEPIKGKGKRRFCYIGNDTKFCFRNIIGSSDVMQKVKNMCSVAAKSDFNVLIQGESGTGKELFAQAIHGESDRKYGPFVAVNCGAIPDNLIESEFFGYEKGAFTGASKEGKPGKFELADGGTIFLDEIGDMPISLQTSLLRVLQEQEVTRIGGYSPISIDVRVIAATNKDLLEEVNKGNFREDLFWRINVIPIHIPPLKERKDDILELIKYFIAKHAKDKKRKLEFHPEVIEIFNHYDWPGNVRELENLVKRLLVFVDGNLVKCKDLPDYMTKKSEKIDYNSNLSLAQIEKAIIEKTLKENNNNISETARKLKISRNTIYNKLGVKKFSNC